MPQVRVEVPQSGGSNVGQRPESVVLTSGAAPAGAFGEGAEAVQAELGQVGQAVTSHTDEEQDRANKLWFLTTESEMAKKQLDIESRAKKRKGRDSFGLHNETEHEFDTYADSIKTNNKAQSMALEQLKLSRRTSLGRFVTGHVNTETEQVETQESKAYRFNLTNSASSHYEDPGRFGEDKLKFNAAVQDEIEREGMGSEAAKAFKLGQNTAFHAATIKNMLANEDHAMAREYYNRHDDEMSEAFKERMGPTLKEAGLRTDSQTATEQLILEFGTWKERHAAAKKRYKGELEDRIVGRLDQEEGREARFERADAEETHINTLNTIDEKLAEASKMKKNLSARDALGPDVWAGLDLNERVRYENYAAANASRHSNNPAVIANLQRNQTIRLGSLWELYGKADKEAFMTATSGYTKNPKTGKVEPNPLNLEFLRAEIGDAEYNRFKGYQQKIREGAAKDNEDMINDRIADSIDDFKIKFSIGIMADQLDKSADDPHVKAQLDLAQKRGVQKLREYVEGRLKTIPVEKQTPEEVDKIVNEAWLSTDVKRKAGFLGAVWSPYDTLSESVEDPYGMASLPLFISDELAKAGEIHGKRTEFSDSARTWFSEKHGVPTGSNYDGETHEFFVKGKGLKTYLRHHGLPSEDKNGNAYTGVWIGLNGKVVNTSILDDQAVDEDVYSDPYEFGGM